MSPPSQTKKTIRETWAAIRRVLAPAGHAGVAGEPLSGTATPNIRAMTPHNSAVKRALLAIWLALAVSFLAPTPDARAGQAERLSFLGTDFIAYWVDLGVDDLGLFWRDSADKPFGTFAGLAAHEPSFSNKLLAPARRPTKMSRRAR